MNALDSYNGASRTDFRTSFDRSKHWNPLIKLIVGQHLLRDSTLEEDTKEATDLIVLKSDGIRVACRVREYGYANTFPFDVTITCRRESGAKCEWDKMVLGDWADWFFYGHGSQTL